MSVFKLAATAGTVAALAGLFVLAAVAGATTLAGGGVFTRAPWWSGVVLVVAGGLAVYGGARYSLATSPER